MIEAWHYHPDRTPEPVAPADISELCTAEFPADQFLWVDLLDPSAEELRLVAEEFSLHPLALEGAMQVGERAKLDRFPSHEFVVIYDANVARISIFLATTWAITVRSAEAEVPATGLERIRTRFDELPRRDAGWFTYVVLDEFVDGYETRIDALENDVEQLEDRIVAANGAVSGKFEHEVLDTRRTLLALRRIVVPARDVLQEIRRSHNPALHDREVEIALADVQDHLLRVVELLDAQRELLGNAFEAHLSLQANQMNQVMKQLTSWGSIVFGATLIAGIYGMNFTHMPELSWYYGYPLALATMAALSLVLYRVFKRREWL